MSVLSVDPPVESRESAGRRRIAAADSRKSVLHELEDQNPAVAVVFQKLRHSVSHLSSSAAPFPLNAGAASRHRRFHILGLFSTVNVALALIALFWVASLLLSLTDSSSLVRDAEGRMVVQPDRDWLSVLLPIAAFVAGAVGVLAFGRLNTAPLQYIEPPDENSDIPLIELAGLAERTASRLRIAYRVQLTIELTVAVLFVALVVWSMVLASEQRTLYASVFGAGAAATAIVGLWKWRPRRRVEHVRRLLREANSLATGLRVTARNLFAIRNPCKRANAQWKTVEQYLDWSI
jgi:hypothetical protein